MPNRRFTITIDDPEDPRVADFVGLRDARVLPGRFIVEGELAIRALLTSSYTVRAVWLTPSLHARLEPVLSGQPVFISSRDVMQKVAGFDIHRGAVASADRRPLPSLAAVLASSTRIAILEGLNDHENLGALFRNAAAFGVDAVVLDPTCADPLYRRCVRVSLGHVLHVPFARCDRWPEDLETVTAADFEVVALTPRADSDPISALERAERIAFMLGAEGPGLSEDALRFATRRVRIPMSAGVDSINVATAAAIAFFAAYHHGR